MRVIGVHPDDARTPGMFGSDTTLPVRQIIRPKANAHLDHTLAVCGFPRLDALRHLFMPPLPVPSSRILTQSASAGPVLTELSGRPVHGGRARGGCAQVTARVRIADARC